MSFFASCSAFSVTGGEGLTAAPMRFRSSMAASSSDTSNVIENFMETIRSDVVFRFLLRVLCDWRRGIDGRADALQEFDGGLLVGYLECDRELHGDHQI